jgi:hypothetical protein
MYFIELKYTNGKSIRLPTPYFMYMDAHSDLLKYHTCKQEYTAVIVGG